MGKAKSQAGAKRRVIMKRKLKSIGLLIPKNTTNKKLEKLWKTYVKKPIPSISRYKNDLKNTKYKSDLDKITKERQEERKSILKAMQIPGISKRMAKGEQVPIKDIISGAEKEITQLKKRMKTLNKIVK